MAVSRANIFNSSVWLDEHTFEDLFQAHYQQVYAVLFRLTGNQYEADDLAAETFWRLWQKPPARNENIAGWLYRVATYTGYNALRDSKRRAVYEEAAAASEWQKNLEDSQQLDPAGKVEQRQERQRVRQVWKGMALRDVQVLILRYSGLSYKEIAATLEISTASVGTVLSRAEARFEALYRKGEEHAPER
ncbi:MAG TPA: sigma-70 family RNA polymerase sigma factor [Anaerolineaceae bacterium]